MTLRSPTCFRKTLCWWWRNLWSLAKAAAVSSSSRASSSSSSSSHAINRWATFQMFLLVTFNWWPILRTIYLHDWEIFYLIHNYDINICYDVIVIVIIIIIIIIYFSILWWSYSQNIPIICFDKNENPSPHPKPPPPKKKTKKKNRKTQ